MKPAGLSAFAKGFDASDPVVVAHQINGRA
jgi:hypothetical protein